MGTKRGKHGQDESRETGSGQILMIQKYPWKGRITWPWPGTWLPELKCQGSDFASATYKLCDFRLRT